MTAPKLRVLVFDINRVYATLVATAIMDHIDHCQADVVINATELRRRVAQTQYNLIIADIADANDQSQVSEALDGVTTTVVWAAHSSGLQPAVGHDYLMKPTVADIKSYVAGLLSGNGAVLIKPTRELTGLVVLVVDDHPDTLEVVSTILRRFGANVISAGDAGAVFEVLKKTTPDLLISDIGMPNIDGFDLLKRVRKLPCCSGLPAIAFTAFIDDLTKVNCDNAGFKLMLSKPIEPALLLEAILKLTKKP